MYEFEDLRTATARLYRERAACAQRRIDQDVKRGLSADKHDSALVARYTTLARITEQATGSIYPPIIALRPSAWGIRQAA